MANQEKNVAINQKAVIVEPLLAKSSDRAWKPVYSADAPPLFPWAVFLRPVCRGVVHPLPATTHSALLLFLGRIAWGALRLAGAEYRFSSPRNVPFLRSGKGKRASQTLTRRYRYE